MHSPESSAQQAIDPNLAGSVMASPVELPAATYRILESEGSPHDVQVSDPSISGL